MSLELVKLTALKKELAPTRSCSRWCPLPQVIRMSKNHLGLKAVVKKHMLSKLFAIVKGQRPELRFVGA